MIFIDTNYLIRFLLRDVETHFQQSKDLFLRAARQEINLITSLVTIFEIVWVLESRYNLEREELSEKLYQILRLNMEIPDRELLFETLYLYRNSNLELEDCYNLCFAKQQKVEDFKTFDQKLIRRFKAAT